MKIVHGVHERIANKMDDFVQTGAAIYGKGPDALDFGRGRSHAHKR